MQNSDVVQAVLKHPKYQELLRRRTRTSLVFFVLTIIIYAGFILTLAFDPELFGRPLSDSVTMSIGVFVATLVAISAVVLVSAYVYMSNRVFDPILDEIVRDVS